MIFITTYKMKPYITKDEVRELMAAFAEHGTVRGFWLTFRRLLRCRPLGPSGFDPGPERCGTQHTAQKDS